MKALLIITAATVLTAMEGARAECVIAGAKDAPITIQEFADLQCPYCVRGNTVMKEIVKAYPGKIKIVFRNLPLDSHGEAMNAAKSMAAICMQDPVLGEKFKDEIFAHEDKLQSQGVSYTLQVARDIGVDVDKMKVDMDSPEVAKSLAEDKKLFDTNFQGVPSFIVGNEPMQGAHIFLDYKALIDKQLGQ